MRLDGEDGGGGMRRKAPYREARRGYGEDAG